MSAKITPQSPKRSADRLDEGSPNSTAEPDQTAMKSTDWDSLPVLFPLLPITAELTGMGRTYLFEAARSRSWLRPAVVRFGRSIRIQRDVLRRLIEEGGDRR